MSGPRPVVVICELCKNDPAGRISTNSARAWHDAIDHGLDHHRAQLVGHPHLARRWFRIVRPAQHSSPLPPPLPR